MTTREEVIALRNECDEFAEQDLQCKGEFHPDFHTVSDERFYAIAHEAGAASRDAEIVSLEIENENANEQRYRVLEERDQLRAELAAALAACKAKDEALLTCQPGDCSTGHVICPSFDERLVESALAIQPDDSALKAWLGEPVAWEFTDAFGTHYTDDQRDWMDTPGIESVTHLYSPKELK